MASRSKVSLKDSEIDAAILDSVGSEWKKVALVIGRTARRLQGIMPDDEATHDRIAARVEALAAQGRLQRQGNLKRWRHSEIRRPD